MLQNQLGKVKWVRIGLFLLACLFGICGVATNRVEFALLSSLSILFSFYTFKKKKIMSNETVIINKYKINSDQFVLTITLLIYALLLAGIAVFLSQKPSTGIVSLILWVISIGFILAAGIVFDGRKPFAWVNKLKSFGGKERKKLIIEISIVILITGIGFALRVINLDIYPTAMHGDEGEIGMESLRFLGVGEPMSPFTIGWGPVPSLYFLVKAVFISVFGRNEIGLRMMSALFGTGCIPLVYLIGKKCWGKIAGVAGAWLIAVSHFIIQYSRISIGCIEPAFFMLLFFFLFLNSNFENEAIHPEGPPADDSNYLHKKENAIFTYILMGVTAGLAQYMYLGTRIIPIILLPLIIFQLFRKKINLTQIAILGFSAILVFAPIGYHYIQHPDQFSSRLDRVFIFTQENIQHNYGPDATLSNSFFKIVVNQINQNLRFFLQSGDRSSFYFANIPAFDSISAFFFWMGLGLLFTRPRRLPELTMIVWFVIGIFLGGVITNDAPSGSRLIITAPIFFIICGVFIQRTWDAVNSAYKQLPNIHLSLGWLISPIILAGIAATLYINYNYNFVIYPKAGINILSISITNEINAIAPSNHVYLFGIGDLYSTHGTIKFLAGDRKVIDISNLEDLPPVADDGKGITVLATYSNFEHFAEITSLYPQGVLTDEYRDGFLVFKKFQIPPLK